MPDPIIEPTTIMVASTGPNPRINFTAGGGTIKSVGEKGNGEGGKEANNRGYLAANSGGAVALLIPFPSLSLPGWPVWP